MSWLFKVGIIDWAIVAQVAVGALISIGFVILIEYLRKPRLEMKIATPEDPSYTPRHPAQQARYLGLLIENKKLPYFAKWLSRNAAIHCSGIITFHHLDGQNVFGRSMQGRWSGTPEPVPLQAILPGGQQMQIIDPIRLSPEFHRNIHPGEAEKLDVVARFDKDVECYGWCNDNYFSNPRWRNPNWELNPGRYLVKVVITSSGESCGRLFRIVNDVPINSFRLGKGTSEDKKLIH